MIASNYNLLAPEYRNSVPEVWEGFDLRGMGVGSTFRGCKKCGVQINPCDVACNQCPNCLGELPMFTVTARDVAVASRLRRGVIVE